MQKKFDHEIKKLDNVYSEMLEALLNKPDTQDYELSRIYFENVAARLNKWIKLVNEVKGSLEQASPIGDISADNRPA